MSEKDQELEALDGAPLARVPLTDAEMARFSEERMCGCGHESAAHDIPGVRGGICTQCRGQHIATHGRVTKDGLPWCNLYRPVCNDLNAQANAWRTELRARMAAERRYAELSAAFKKLVRKWRDELNGLLEKP